MPPRLDDEDDSVETIDTFDGDKLKRIEEFQTNASSQLYKNL